VWTIVDVKELVMLRNTEALFRYYYDETMSMERPEPINVSKLPNASTSCDSRELVLLREFQKAEIKADLHDKGFYERQEVARVIFDKLQEVRNGFRA